MTLPNQLRALFWAIMAAVVVASSTSSVYAQDTSTETYPVYEERFPVASLNRERLLAESAYGKALIGRLTDRQTALAEENLNLQSDLEEEERALTEQRKILTAQEFKPLAEAFDTKVKSIRRVQEDKRLQLEKALQNARFGFFRRTEVIIAEIMQTRGIQFLLDEQAVLLSTGQGDITNEVITVLDQLFAEGALPIE